MGLGRILALERLQGLRPPSSTHATRPGWRSHGALSGGVGKAPFPLSRTLTSLPPRSIRPLVRRLPSPPQSIRRRRAGGIGLTLLSASLLTTAYYTIDPVRHTCQAVTRCTRAAMVGLVVGLDYKYTLWQIAEEDALSPKALSIKSALHRRSAIRVRGVLEANGGVYIKLVR